MTNKLASFFAKLPIAKQAIEVSKKLILPGFDGLPVYDVVSFFYVGISKGALGTRAAALSFNFFLALFPLIIFLFTLIPYIPIDNFQEQLLVQLKLLLPQEAYILTKSTIEDLVKTPRGGLLSFGFIFTIYFATNGINAMMSAFGQSYHVTIKRSAWKQRIIAVALTFIISFLIVIAVALIAFGTITLHFINDIGIIESKISLFLLQVAQWFIIMLLCYFTISFLYFFGPPKHTSWKFFSAGSSLATVLMMIVSSGFAYFVNNFGQYNKLYGSIGTLIVIMLFIQFNSAVLLLGFELNASIRSGTGAVR